MSISLTTKRAYLFMYNAFLPYQILHCAIHVVKCTQISCHFLQPEKNNLFSPSDCISEPSPIMPEDDFDIYGEDDGFNAAQNAQVGINLH